MNSDSSYIAQSEYIVYLDLTKLPSESKKLEHSAAIAQNLLNFCGVTQIWDEPRHNRRLFYVKELPQDIPQVGVHWIEANVPVFNGRVLK